MSSILKALKKIEQEESREGKETHPWPNSIQSARQTVKKEGRKKIILISSAMACFILAAGGIYLGSNMKPSKKPGDKPDTVAATALMQARQTRPNISSSPIVKNPPHLIPPNHRPTEPSTPEAEEPPPALAAENNRDGSLPDMETTDSSVSPNVVDLSDGEPQVIEPAVADVARHLPGIKNDSRINIQAIAWAEEPDRRFVVINNSIIREGGSVDDGITVVSIEADIVHFSENGNEWRQRFIVR